MFAYTLPILLERYISKTYVIPLTLAIVVLLYLHTFGYALTTDDYFHKILSVDIPNIPKQNFFLNFFTFADGNPQRMQELIDYFAVPWWVDPDIKVSFFRPLSVATHWFDYALWPDNIALQRIHGILWYLITGLFVFLLYKNIFKDRKIAILGFLLFILSLQHYIPVAWIASRNSIITGCFSVLTLLCYYKAVTEQWTMGYVLTPLFLVCALLSGEAGLGITAMLFACSVFLDERSKFKALGALLPSFFVSIVWLYFYQAMGYGASGSGLYAEPQSQPLKYIEFLAMNIPVLITGDWLNITPEFLLVLKNLVYISVFISLLLIGCLGYSFVWPVVKKDKFAKFWLLAYVFALFPASSTLFGSRALMIPSIASVGLILSLFNYALKNDTLITSSNRVFLNSILFFHILFPVGLLAAAYVMPAPPNSTYPVFPETLRQQGALKNKTALIFDGEYLQGTAAASEFLLDKKNVNKMLHLFSPSSDFYMQHTKNNTLIIKSVGENSLISIERFHTNSFIRDFKKKPLKAGDEFLADDIKIKIEKYNLLLGPTQISYSFPKKLNNENYVCLYLNSSTDKFELFELPQPGEQVFVSYKNKRYLAMGESKIK